MPRELSIQQSEDLKSWLEDQEISLYKIHWELSDAIGVANLLKKYYPKYVDIHNYPSRSSTPLKLANWVTLNNRVLSRIGLPQTQMMMDKYSKSVPGCIELLLYDIMNLNEVTAERVEKHNKLLQRDPDVVIVNLDKFIDGESVVVPEKMIKYSIFERLQLESQAKDIYLNEANEKIGELEELIRHYVETPRHAVE